MLALPGQCPITCDTALLQTETGAPFRTHPVFPKGKSRATEWTLGLNPGVEYQTRALNSIPLHGCARPAVVMLATQ